MNGLIFNLRITACCASCKYSPYKRMGSNKFMKVCIIIDDVITPFHLCDKYELDEHKMTKKLGAYKQRRSRLNKEKMMDRYDIKKLSNSKTPTFKTN